MDLGGWVGGVGRVGGWVRVGGWRTGRRLASPPPSPDQRVARASAPHGTPIPLPPPPHTHTHSLTSPWRWRSQCRNEVFCSCQAPMARTRCEKMGARCSDTSPSRPGVSSTTRRHHEHTAPATRHLRGGEGAGGRCARERRRRQRAFLSLGPSPFSQRHGSDDTDQHLARGGAPGGRRALRHRWRAHRRSSSSGARVHLCAPTLVQACCSGHVQARTQAPDRFCAALLPRLRTQPPQQQRAVQCVSAVVGGATRDKRRCARDSPQRPPCEGAPPLSASLCARHSCTPTRPQAHREASARRSPGRSRAARGGAPPPPPAARPPAPWAATARWVAGGREEEVIGRGRRASHQVARPEPRPALPAAPRSSWSGWRSRTWAR